MSARMMQCHDSPFRARNSHIFLTRQVTEPSRHLALSGAQLLIAIGCNTSSFTLDTLIRVRAFENQCHVIYVNQARCVCQALSLPHVASAEYVPHSRSGHDCAHSATLRIVEVQSRSIQQVRVAAPISRAISTSLYDDRSVC